MKAKEIDYELMDEWFYYDEISPSCLRWKKGNKYNKLIVQGCSVGWKAKNGKGRVCGWRVHLLGKEYSIHRVIWVLLNKHISSEKVIDHIDGNPLNNKKDNLREVSVKVNNRNVRRGLRNITGVMGVFLRESESRRYYYAQWREVSGPYRSRYFSINKYGEEEAFRLACQAREEAIKRLNEQGAGYTETHGEELPY